MALDMYTVLKNSVGMLNALDAMVSFLLLPTSDFLLKGRLKDGRGGRRR
jgi:hypothetical protein